MYQFISYFVFDQWIFETGVFIDHSFHTLLILPKNCNNASYLLPIRIIIINVLTCSMIYTISADKTICNECIYMNDYILYG